MMKENQPFKANLQNHPSFQSSFKPQKPSIKVDYKVIHSSRGNEGSSKKSSRKAFSKKTNNQTSFHSTSNVTQQLSGSNRMVSRVKPVQGSLKQYESGKFIESEYCPTDQSRINESRHIFQKAKVTDAIEKYQHSKSVENIIKEQYHVKRTPSCFVSKSRMQRQKTEPNFSQHSISKINSSSLTTMTHRSGVSERSKLPFYLHEGIKDIIQYEHAGKYREQRVTPKCTIEENQKAIKDRFRAFDQIHDFDFRKRVNTLSNQVRLTKGLR